LRKRGGKSRFVENITTNNKRKMKEACLMGAIPQPFLFGRREIDELGGLKCLLLVINHLSHEDLVQKWERSERGSERNDYPLCAVWDSVLAGAVFQHPFIEGLRRELRRNAQFIP